MLENKVIIYDDACPLCRLYTWWFVAWGFLKPGNRIGFGTAPPEVVDHVDLDRARHEIPLFDRETKATVYGLSALTLILGSRWTWLRPLFRSRAFHVCLYPLYQFITYNRRVIAGCRACCGFDCAPDLNRFWRSAFLVFVAVVYVLAIAALAMNGAGEALVGVGLLLSLLIIGMLGAAITWRNRNKIANRDRPAGWNFLGNHATVVLIAAIGLVPIVLWPSLPAVISAGLLLILTAVVVEELMRRRRTLA